MATNGNPGPYIEFKDVSKAFGDNRVLDHVSFSVMPGETVCILGRSGVGKSVSLMNIMGFLKPDSGRVIVAHEDITDYGDADLERIRKKVTIVFQNGALFDSLSVGENVAFPLRERRQLSEEQIYQIVDGLLDMVGVKEMREQLPDRVMFLHEAKAIFFGTYDEMERCEEPIVQEFLKLDEPGIQASIEVSREPNQL